MRSIVRFWVFFIFNELWPMWQSKHTGSPSWYVVSSFFCFSVASYSATLLFCSEDGCLPELLPRTALVGLSQSLQSLSLLLSTSAKAMLEVLWAPCVRFSSTQTNFQEKEVSRFFAFPALRTKFQRLHCLLSEGMLSSYPSHFQGQMLCGCWPFHSELIYTFFRITCMSINKTDCWEVRTERGTLQPRLTSRPITLSLPSASQIVCDWDHPNTFGTGLIVCLPKPTW